MKNTFYVYLHCKPDGTPFYVGKGNGDRAYRIYSKRNSFHSNVVKKYGAQRILIYKQKIGLTEDQAFAFEREAIKCLREFGYELCNMTDGGEGSAGTGIGRKFSDDHRAKISAALSGKPSPRRGIKLSDEHRAKISASLNARKKPGWSLGRKLSEEHRAKIGTSLKGNKNTLGKIQSNESRAKCSASMKGKQNRLGQKLSAAHRAKIGAALIGKKFSDERKAKMKSAAQLRAKSNEYRAKLSVSSASACCIKSGRPVSWIK